MALGSAQLARELRRGAAVDARAGAVAQILQEVAQERVVMGTRDLAGERVTRPLARVEQRNLALRLAVAGPEKAARLGAVAELRRAGVEDAVERLDERVEHEVAGGERVDQVVRAALAAV